MRKITLGLSSMLLIVCLGACAQNKDVAKRYQNKDEKTLYGNANTPCPTCSPQNFVRVDLNTSLISEAKKQEVKYNVLSLTDEGQKEFIKAVLAKSTDAEALIKTLSTNFSFSKDEKENVKIISKTIKKSIVFTSEKQLYGNLGAAEFFNTPADRIHYLQFYLSITGGHAIFNSWDRYVSDKLTLNLGKVTSGEGWSANLNASAKLGGEVSLGSSTGTEKDNSEQTGSTITLVNNSAAQTGNTASTYLLTSGDKGTSGTTNGAKFSNEIGATGGISYNNKYEASLDLSSEVLHLSGSLGPSRLYLSQQSGPGIDLNGNAIITLEYLLTDDWAAPAQFLKVKDLYNATTGAPNQTGAVSLSSLTVLFPDLTNNVIGTFNYDFEYRQVQKGSRYLPEGRQTVENWAGDVADAINLFRPAGGFVLVKPEDVRPKAYTITVAGNILELNKLPLQFETVSEAATFLRYIIDLDRKALPINTIIAGGAPLTSGNIPALRIITQQL